MTMTMMLQASPVSPVFRKVEGQLVGEAVRHVAAGLAHTLAVTDSGRVYTWGGAEYGVTGVAAPTPPPPGLSIYIYVYT